MSFAFRDNGAWTDVTVARRRENSVWVDVQWVRRRSDDNLSWLDVWPLPRVAITNYTTNGALRAGYRINADGNAEYSIDAVGGGIFYGVIEQWLKSGSASQFAAKAVASADPGYSAPQGFPTDQWIECTSSPEWYVAPDGLLAQLTISIGTIQSGGGAAMADSSGASLLDSSGAAVLDSSITVTPMTSAVVTLSTQG